MAIVSNDVRNYFQLELLFPRSCAILRQLFKDRYSLFNSGQLWNDTSACGTSYFTNTVSKNKKITLTKVQKTSVSSGDTNEWDLSTLTALLINQDRPTTLTTAQIRQLDYKDALLKQLKDIRNELAHHASKSISDTEFHRLWADLSTILIALGDDDSELDKLKDDDVFGVRTQTINGENVKEAQRLNSLGTQANKEGKFVEAISLFTKATVLAGVPDHDRAIFFSNMASSRLALYEQEQESNRSRRFEIDDIPDERYRALQDAKQARNLWPIWWKGHFRVGKVYGALNEHDKAINSFERALALAPTNSDIEKALDESRAILSRQLRQEHLDPRLQPRTMSEHLNELQQKVGIDPGEVRRSHRLIEEIDPAGADVVKGHKYEHGDDDVKQDYEQAAKYFAKAARQGNAEGMYNLARLTDRGLGVKKDHRAALKLLEQAAAQPAQHPLVTGARNVGVAEAEHALGLRYYGGISVHKDFPTAAYWYQRAVDHGSAESANNLAIMYEDGIGVEKNLDKAQQLFELAARSGDPNAMLSLAKNFLDNNELTLAKMWYDRACDAGNIVAQADRGAFEKVLQQRQQLIDQGTPDTLKMMHTMKNFLQSVQETKTIHKQLDQPPVYDYDILNEHAKRGSITAKKICMALEHFMKAMNILVRTETLTEEDENAFVCELAQCYRMNHIVAQILGVKMRQRIVDIVDRALHRCNKDLDTSVSQLDEDTRICYVILHMDSFESVAQFLVFCKQKYPKSIFFYELSSAVYGWLKQYETGLRDANIGLELDPNYCELLYYKAVALRQLQKDMNDAVDAHRKFLAVAPTDHRKVPEAYYAMAVCYIARDIVHDKHESIPNIVKNIYRQGEEAEKLQLPCFLPYKSNSRNLLKLRFDAESLLTAEPNPVIDRKLRLKNPHRVEVISEHREWEKGALQMKLNSNPNFFPVNRKPRLKQQTAKSLVGLKPITLREMNPTEDYVYNGCVLSVTIIEEACSWRPSLHLVIEDDNLDCERIYIYSFPEGQGEHLISKVFTIGSKMHIINPYLRIGANDMKALIRVDDFSSIIMQSESERVMNMCRCCGEANAPHICNRCKQARYCSKECQIMDWQLYKHKFICKSE